MIYAEIKKKKKTVKRVPIDKMTFFCKCRVCREPIEIPLMDLPMFDEETDALCTKCKNEYNI